MLTSDLSRIVSGLSEASAIGGRLGEATDYHLASGGKALRARLALECGHALALPETHSVDLAIACELVHQASVVHDDIQDQAALRRGRESVAAKFGAATALCVGDHLLVSAFARLASLPEGAALLQLFGGVVSQMAAAQAEEFSPVLWQTMTWPRYQALIAGKAGALLVLPVAGSARLAGLAGSDVDQLTQTAQLLGMAYQAGDDIADVACDLARGALNGVIARGLDHAGAAQRACWHERLEQAQRRSLAQSDIRSWAASLQPEAQMVRHWARQLPQGAIAALRAGCSPRGRAVLPVLERAAEWLAGSDRRDLDIHHAA